MAILFQVLKANRVDSTEYKKTCLKKNFFFQAGQVTYSLSPKAFILYSEPVQARWFLHRNQYHLY